MDTFDAFILEHEGDDTARLLLGRDKYPGIDLDLAVTTIEARRRLRTKVPEWYALPSLRYPTRLCAEQCSSTPTAIYKASLAAGVASPEGVCSKTCGHPRPFEGVPPPNTPLAAFSPSTTLPAKSQVRPGACRRLESPRASGRSEAETLSEVIPSLSGKGKMADLTGGLGVDAWAFAGVFGEVLYNEADERLCEAATHNFAALGLHNVTVRNRYVEPGKVKEVLNGFAPDVIYLDPARRAEDGRKVFLLEDCRPDIVALQEDLLEAAPRVLVKLSPMADITMVLQRLKHVREMHVVASGGECKELLIVLERAFAGGVGFTAWEDGATLSWTPEEEALAPLRLPESAGLRPAGAERRWLFEPGKALTKAGAFRLPCARFGLTKLGVHTHLYLADALPEELSQLGKCFEIQEVLPLDKRTMKEAGKRWPRAEVTARNIPLTSEELRRRIGCASGGSVHLFGVRADLPEGPQNLLLVTSAENCCHRQK